MRQTKTTPVDLTLSAADKAPSYPSQGEIDLRAANTDPVRLIEWVMRETDTQHVAMTTGFGMEGCALIDMISKAGARLDVYYIDTGFFFAETHELRARLEEKYHALSFINVGTDVTPDQMAQTQGDRLWARDPDACCRLRKVEPMERAMEDVDIWLTALRRSQSRTRATIELVDWDLKYELLKVSPLAFWEREGVWDYIQRNSVPYNDLHERGYPTVGCTHCTKRVEGATPGTYSREGRWAGQKKTECGLHWMQEELDKKAN